MAAFLALSPGARAERAGGTVRLPVRSGPGFTRVTPAEARVIESIKRTGAVFRNPRFWQHFAHNPALADERVRAWYGQLPGFDRVLEKGRALGRHRVLLLDPGIVQHIDAFVPFAARKLAEQPLITSFGLRRAFARSLEPVTVWRGTMLQPEAAAAVCRRGIRANALAFDERRANAVLAHALFDRVVYETPQKGPYNDMRRRLGGEVRGSLFSSASDFIEVTHAGAWAPRLQGGGPLGRGRFHLFKLQLSPLDVIKPRGIFKGLVQFDGQPMTFTTRTFGGLPWSKRFDDPGFESFFQYAGPREIVETHPYASPPPRWDAQPR